MKVNQINFAFYINKDDRYPPLRIKIYNEDTDSDFDLLGWVGKFYMAPVDDKSNPKVDAGTVVLTDPTGGEAEYQWAAGDTDTSGKYYYEFRFTKDSKTFTVPAVSPGVIVINSKIGS